MDEVRNLKIVIALASRCIEFETNKCHHLLQKVTANYIDP